MNFSTRFSLVWKLHPIFSARVERKETSPLGTVSTICVIHFFCFFTSKDTAFCKKNNWDMSGNPLRLLHRQKLHHYGRLDHHHLHQRADIDSLHCYHLGTYFFIRSIRVQTILDAVFLAGHINDCNRLFQHLCILGRPTRPKNPHRGSTVVRLNHRSRIFSTNNCKTQIGKISYEYMNVYLGYCFDF